MIERLHELVAALREELQQYGEMLALLDRQQDFVVARATEDLFQSVAAIQRQAVAIQQVRQQRDDRRQALARALERPDGTSFLEIIPLLPIDYRPLVEALVQENNQLLFRIQQRARQNHLLLTRSVELMQRFLGTLFPSRETQVYDDHGTRQVVSLPLRALYDAVG